MERREPRSPSEAVLRLHGAHATNLVSADAVIRALTGMQQTVLLVAASDTRHVVRERFRPTERLRQRATLLCEAPTTGSFAIPMRLADEQLSLDFANGKTLGILEVVHSLLGDVLANAYSHVSNLLPDTSIRHRVVREIQRILPKVGERWRFGFSAFHRGEVVLDDRNSRTVDDWLAETPQEDTVMTITGDLERVFFDTKTIHIKYKPTGRRIVCEYRADVEEEILERRGVPVQVTGKFRLDEEGHPEALTDVYRINHINTSPMSFEHLQYAGRTFVFTPPLDLTPQIDDESGQLYVATYPDFDIHVFAATREQLVSELAEQVAFLWDEYANYDPQKLAPSARALRDALRAGIHVQGAE